MDGLGLFRPFFSKIIAYIIIRFISLFDCAGFYRSGSFFGLRNIYMVWLNIHASTCLSSLRMQDPLSVSSKSTLLVRVQIGNTEHDGIQEQRVWYENNPRRWHLAVQQGYKEACQPFAYFSLMVVLRSVSFLFTTIAAVNLQRVLAQSSEAHWQLVQEHSGANLYVQSTLYPIESHFVLRSACFLVQIAWTTGYFIMGSTRIILETSCFKRRNKPNNRI